jgi:dTDP-4-amino-4,6-dideoxygalactose transaminase
LSDWSILLSDIRFGPEEEEAVLRVLRSGWVTMGPEVGAFEREFAEFLGTESAIAVASGTAALHLSLLVLGIGTGDEVIQPAVNFVAAGNMTLAVGAEPVFADICSLEEPTIDPVDVMRRITPRTRAVVVMHYGGYPCRMRAIAEICRDRGLFLIEDACHGIGAACEGVKLGAWGDTGAFSFYGNKNLATGEGGMVVTGREEVARKIRTLRSHGMTTLTWDRYKGHASSYDVTNPGYNYRLDEIHAALGRVQLEKLPRNNRLRAERVGLYRERLAVLKEKGWVIPFAHVALSEEDRTSACHLMTVVAPDGESRGRAVEALKKARVQTSLHYPLITRFRCFQDRERPAAVMAGAPPSGTTVDGPAKTGPAEAAAGSGSTTPGSTGAAELNVAPEFCRRAITLPLFPDLKEEAVHFICDTLIASTT